MAIALVAHVARATPGTSASINTTGANFIAIIAGAIVSSGATPGLPTITDSKSNVYSLVGSAIPTNNACACLLYVCANPTVGSGHTFTCANAFSSICVAAFSGVETVFPMGLPTSNTTATTGTSIQPGSLTPAIDNCLMIAGVAYRDTTTITVNQSFSITDQNVFSSGVAIGAALAYIIETTATAKNPTFSWTNSAANDAVMAYFRTTIPAAGGGGAFGFA